MLFPKVKKCKDKKVIQAGLNVLTDFRNNGMNVQAFGCCFVKGILVISFDYGISYPHDLQTAMAVQVAKLLSEDEKYRKLTYYSSDIFNEKCGKYRKNLWLKVQE